MKNILLFFIIFILFGCATQDRCSRLYPAKTITKDSIVYKTQIITKDSIIYVKVPVQIGTVESTVNCDSLGAQMKKVTLDNKRLRMTIEIVNGKLIAVSTCKEDSLAAIISKQKEIISDLQKNNSFIQVPNYIYKMHWYEKLLFYLGFIGLGFLIYIGYKIFRKIKSV